MTAIPRQTEHSESPSSVELILIPPEQVLDEGVRAFLKDVVAPCARNSQGSFTTESILDEVEREESLLFMAVEELDDTVEILAVMLCELKIFAEIKLLSIFGLYGREMHRWIHLMEKIEDFARSMKLDGVEVCGRRGWQRVLKGYDYSYTVLRKDLRQ